MTQSFGIDIATIDDSAVEAGLELLSQPPDWIVAIEDLDRMRADLERVVPELASGRAAAQGVQVQARPDRERHLDVALPAEGRGSRRRFVP